MKTFIAAPIETMIGAIDASPHAPDHDPYHSKNASQLRHRARLNCQPCASHLSVTRVSLVYLAASHLSAAGLPFHISRHLL